MTHIVITGTDTDIGKTVFSAALMAGLEAAGFKPHYWKPIQSGIETIDKHTVKNLSGIHADRFLPERYVLTEPLSPHRSAELDDVLLDADDLHDSENIPPCDGALVIEGAGGLMVPLTREDLQIDLYKAWDIPVVLCTRTTLGTINHSLLSVEALKARNIPIKGLVFIGEDNSDNIRTIAEFSGVPVLGHMPMMEKINAESLRDMFAARFKATDFVDP